MSVHSDILQESLRIVESAPELADEDLQDFKGLNPDAPPSVNRMFYVLVLLGVIFRIALTLTHDDAADLNEVLSEMYSAELLAIGGESSGEKTTFVEPHSDMRAFVRALLMILKGVSPKIALESLLDPVGPQDLRAALQVAEEMCSESDPDVCREAVPQLALALVNPAVPDEHLVCEVYPTPEDVKLVRYGISEWMKPPPDGDGDGRSEVLRQAYGRKAADVLNEALSMLDSCGSCESAVTQDVDPPDWQKVRLPPIDDARDVIIRLRDFGRYLVSGKLFCTCKIGLAQVKTERGPPELSNQLRLFAESPNPYALRSGNRYQVWIASDGEPTHRCCTGGVGEGSIPPLIFADDSRVPWVKRGRIPVLHERFRLPPS